MRYALVATVLIAIIACSLVIGFGRYNNTPTPLERITSIPKLVYDYVYDIELSVITIHGFDDYLYDNITVAINGSVYREDYIFGYTIKTYSKDFDIDIVLWAKDTKYIFNGHISIIPGMSKEDTHIKLIYTDINGRENIMEVMGKDLPLKIKLFEESG